MNNLARFGAEYVGIAIGEYFFGGWEDGLYRGEVYIPGTTDSNFSGTVRLRSGLGKVAADDCECDYAV